MNPNLTKKLLAIILYYWTNCLIFKTGDKGDSLRVKLILFMIVSLYGIVNIRYNGFDWIYGGYAIGGGLAVLFYIFKNFEYCFYSHQSLLKSGYTSLYDFYLKNQSNS